MSTEDGKPGLFSRLRRAISSSVDEAMDSMSDPGRELALMLDDLAEEIKNAEKDLKSAVVERKMMERKIEETKKKEAAWQGRAEQAIKLGDETLARAALERKVEVANERRELETGVVEQTKLVEDMRDHIDMSKKKLKSLNMRRGTLMAQARAAKHGESSAAAVGMAQSSRLNDIEDKIAHLEAMNEVHAETAGSAMEEMRIDAELRKLDAGSELDDELAALKAKLSSQQKALEEGKD
ncbi:PspA/IM30 family protein [Pseudenhygromyxa sp. WMMC2535]|uniref:PspA/IM30 family protein n=1 Tax=Pseudenhygromyxa sp. WMMC2535 TaxID=2712867 RepID=UPI0015535DF8|nr:PspA/IM30 family protein [Pseudenhygromyxa sp. WMMC2535]NVB40907.1 PspA/IM30 family protein [Pseudenhygromyxa sp. WMMC2535]